MDRERFARGMTYEAYVAGMEKHRDEAMAIYCDAGVPIELRDFFRQYAGRHGGVIHVAVFSDDSCPDCTENVPVMARLISEIPEYELRMFRRDEHLDTLIELFPGDKPRIPTFAFYDAEWRHLMTWVERPLGATRFLEEGMRELRRRLHEQYQTRFRAEMLNEVMNGLRAAEEW